MLNKIAVHSACVDLLNERMQLIRDEMVSLQASAEEETKSSAGDKYETAREMIQAEKEKVASRSEEAAKFLSILKALRPAELYEEVRVGSLIETDSGWMYLAVGLGAVKVDSTKVFVISPISPIGQALLNKKKGDTFHVNGKVQRIKQLF